MRLATLSMSHNGLFYFLFTAVSIASAQPRRPVEQFAQQMSYPTKVPTTGSQPHWTPLPNVTYWDDITSYPFNSNSTPSKTPCPAGISTSFLFSPTNPNVGPNLTSIYGLFSAVNQASCDPCPESRSFQYYSSTQVPATGSGSNYAFACDAVWQQYSRSRAAWSSRVMPSTTQNFTITSSA